MTVLNVILDNSEYLTYIFYACDCFSGHFLTWSLVVQMPHQFPLHAPLLKETILYLPQTLGHYHAESKVRIEEKQQWNLEEQKRKKQ